MFLALRSVDNLIIPALTFSWQGRETQDMTEVTRNGSIKLMFQQEVIASGFEREFTPHPIHIQ